MASSRDRDLAFLFGVLAAVLLLVEGVIDFFGGFVLLAFGSGVHALGAWDRSVIDVVVGLVVGLFAFLGRSGTSDRTLAAGVVLVVLAIVGWFGLGFSNGVLALVAALFSLTAGVLYVVAAR